MDASIGYGQLPSGSSRGNLLESSFESTKWLVAVPTGPLLVYAVYRRNWRLLLAGLAWAVLNPFLFSSPESEDAWMTRAVLAERWWVREEGNRTIGLSYPNICNTAGALAFIYTLYAAWQQRPAGTTLGTLMAVGLKIWWLRILVQRYNKRPVAR